MTEEKILKDELMNEDELDNIAGGTLEDSVEVAIFLKHAGFENMLKSGGLEANYSAMRDALQSMGITAHDHGGLKVFFGKENSYTVNATGKTLNQKEMMKFLQEKYPNVK